MPAGGSVLFVTKRTSTLYSFRLHHEDNQTNAPRVQCNKCPIMQVKETTTVLVFRLVLVRLHVENVQSGYRLGEIYF